MNNKDLLKQYVSTGRIIPEYQLARLNNNFRTSYYYARKIALGQSDEIENYEFKYLPNGEIKDKFESIVVIRDPYKIKFMSNPSENVKIIAVRVYGGIIRFIDNPSEQVQLAALSKHGNIIEDILANNIIPSEQVQLAAVSKTGDAIEHIIAWGINPSEEVQLAAVKNNGWVIYYIKNPSEAVQLAAVNNKGDAIQYIVSKNIYPSDKVQMAAVTNDANSINYVKNPSPKAIELRDRLNGWSPIK